ncbi:YcjF family protein [Chelatococcus reniformis]|uniref:UPF0283 membrane protein n=1 Tax=Chelatococcus reniformis TaxID=1494448 RepID=A0A916XLN7_9HYPH|nr:TIGR01620 family protein [Chelatococcus reniformis]GGC84366.1 UPF0283 membrane protein [Chelatococcus reniformis]
MTTPPRAFRLDDPDVLAVPAGEAPAGSASVVVAAEDGEIVDAVAEPEAPRRGTSWGGLFLSALGGLALLGIGLWIESLITQLLALAPALGYVAMALAALAVLAFLVLLAREVAGVLRERRIERLRRAAVDAHAEASDDKARAVVRDLLALYANRADTARARAALDGLGDAIIDPRDRLMVAERELMTALDLSARRTVARAARQVSLVTTISPRAIVDVGFVLYSSFRLIRQLASIYGGRPGFLGFLRLARNVLAHLALTGGMAAGDSLIQQVMGLGVAARVSAKLGEGVLNGMLTARVGLAAIDVCRPLPFEALSAPTFTEVAGHLIESKTE